MTTATLDYINRLMQRIGIHYRFMEWKTKPPDEYYFVGEYFENPSPTREENGRQDITFILRGFTRANWMSLEEAKGKIEECCGIKAILPDGTGIAISYDGAQPVPTADNQLKSIKINLQIQEWKVK